ncbi:ImmA/IrrE family metallo-endopeptidase [Micromonospora sp. WMMD964]|uniref:helix-turn-helix domain-containing protein n=1 Tax=Micromonospora sp. WMMD964 TaxID=3016091 RepID=UPI00249CE40A|nr:ImmA/IrrE family metallo-endopeptidase [Micromonospora sp. WMMD964]WFF01559.1 ImmA/IrrE family metallo-endopeptidase [Micromonospora sp. WMMD964]
MFTPSRLSLARKRRGMSAAELARRIDKSTQSVSNYECGRQKPSEETLARIAAELEFPLAFFSRPPVEHVTEGQVSFRARTKLLAGPRDAALATATLAFELNNLIDARFRLPTANVPTLERHRPEEAAEFVRAKWGIGELSPAPNMVHLLEANGVRVFSLAPEHSDVDAFSFWREGIPFVVLNTMKSGERGRFDAAHELGHLVLHGHNGCATWPKDSEREANHFASAFLMPRISVRSRIPNNPTTDQVLRAKQYWRVAALALAYRANDIGMFSEWNYRRCLIELGKLGYRVGEPGGIQRETSQVLDKVFRGLRKQHVHPSQIAAELDTSVDDLSMLVFGLVMTALDGTREASPRPEGPGLKLLAGGRR